MTTTMMREVSDDGNDDDVDVEVFFPKEHDDLK